MNLFKKLFKTKEAPNPGISEDLSSVGYKPIQLPTSNDAIVDSIVQSMLARETCRNEGTFETGEKNPARILCSDNSCPCTDKAHLIIGQTAYLYISQAVVDFRKDCVTLLERDMMLQKVAQKYGAGLFLDGGIANPFYLCKTGAKRRGLDLSVSLTDAKMVAETGFAPLRPTPKA